MDPITLAIVDENEIFRRGLVACVEGDPAIRIAYAASESSAGTPVALVIASAEVAAAQALGVPLLVCTDAPLPDAVRSVNTVMGVLPRAALKPAQLLAGVRAVASGLQVNLLEAPATSLSERHVEVLRLLAQGVATRQISDSLGYSERTIKHAV
ncbi:MAG: LuxR C-terminal-related transcriptional regulator, partial [Dehalococcoidia bacterium]